MMISMTTDMMMTGMMIRMTDVAVNMIQKCSFSDAGPTGPESTGKVAGLK